MYGPWGTTNGVEVGAGVVVALGSATGVTTTAKPMLGVAVRTGLGNGADVGGIAAWLLHPEMGTTHIRREPATARRRAPLNLSMSCAPLTQGYTAGRSAGSPAGRPRADPGPNGRA